MEIELEKDRLSLPLDNFSLYGLRDCKIPLCDYSYSSGHQGHNIFVHRPLETNVIIAEAGNRLIAWLNRGPNTDVTTWQINSPRNISLFGIAHPKEYEFDIYQQNSELQLYGISLHFRGEKNE